MNLLRLPAGAQASYSADRIHVWRTASGAYDWSGALAANGVAALGCGTGYPSASAAEADAIGWAESFAVGMLHIQDDTK